VKVRFLADADLNRDIVRGVLRREPSLDFLTAQAAGLRALKDLDVLALAAEQQRVLVSPTLAPCRRTSVHSGTLGPTAQVYSSYSSSLRA
jgi:hypothetical protein